MHVIPKPQLLDPERPLRDLGPRLTADHRSRAEVLDIALHDSCRYAEHLWDTLNATRQYLLDTLPGTPDLTGHLRQTASPAGPDDDEGWARWSEAFTAVASALCGPGGNPGFGHDRAQEESQHRRFALARATTPDHPAAAAPSAPDTIRSSAAKPQPAAGVPRTDTPTEPPSADRPSGPSPMTFLATTALTVLALRRVRHGRRQ
jgi:hypothetical protein